jgi:hypothetical protein
LSNDAKKEEGININNLNIKIPSSGKVIFGIRPEHLFLKKEHALRVTKDTNFVEIEVNLNCMNMLVMNK